MGLGHQDGAQVVDVLLQRKYVTVFYGHIHQEHHHSTGAIAHHAARSLIFPLPAPGSQPKRAPLAWNATGPDHGPSPSPTSRCGTDVAVGQPVRVRLVPQAAGTFEFHCDVFCGSGHEEMSGRIVVKP
jgi:hypothetical protein